MAAPRSSPTSITTKRGYERQIYRTIIPYFTSAFPRITGFSFSFSSPVELIHQLGSVPKRTLSSHRGKGKKEIFHQPIHLSFPHLNLSTLVITTRPSSPLMNEATRESLQKRENRRRITHKGMRQRQRFCAVTANRVLANGSSDYKIYVQRGREGGEGVEFVGFT